MENFFLAVLKFSYHIFSNPKKYLTVFENVRVDEVLEDKKKPLLDNNYEIDEVGVGLRFIDDWKYKFNINKYNIVKKES